MSIIPPLNNKSVVKWHPKLNNTSTPSTVTSRKNWWICNKNHEFSAKTKNKNTTPTCPICSFKTTLPGSNDLQTLNPKLAAQFHPTLNNELTPTQVNPKSTKKVWWLGECGHEWEATINSRAIPHKTTKTTTNCPYCAGTKLLPGFNDLSTTNPETAKLWHPTLNGNLTPNQISKSNKTKVWWLGECGHEWERPASRQIQHQCPVCTGHSLQPGINDLQTLYPEIATQFHPTLNGKLTPNQITSKNGKNVWWLCEKGHEWETKVSNRTNTNSKCPTCANRKLLTGFNDLATTHPNLAAEFHPTLNNELTPNQITAGRKQNIWWQCEKNHEWEASPSNRSLLKTQCPICQANTYISSSEKELTSWLKTLNIKTETSNRNLIKGEIDIYLPDHKIAIEYNGLYWHTEQAGKQKNYHRNKWEQCNQQNIQLIQIWEDDWKQNPQLIKTMLTHKLGISKQPTIYARNTIIKPVPTEQAEKFLTTHHLQGYRPAKYWGLYTKTNPQTLIAILGTQTRKQTIEIIRYATKNKIPGGFTKLLHHIIKQHPTATKIITYSHNDHSTGSLYQNTGFTKKHTGKPGYSYWKNGWTKRQNRLKYSPKNIQKNPTLTYHPNTPETQLAELNNLKRIWDTGSTLWEKNLTPNQPI